ncbi:hypothetical protein [Rhodanobacter sp. A1T4]|uniref:hypothetical protein n=1 Tax=Rhodanobacter sp. A1T4 TaxID=2723087 RepID=UPI00160FCED8|nr:hypothetical protein [Rhodanobacter sp. A1T4]MBB6249064.1 hypothetical protein [Rhodanobacter sp. A1T4]
MAIENFNLTMRGQVFVFVVAKSTERLSALESVLRDLGAKVVGPQMFALRKEKTAQEKIKESIGNLGEGESVYILDAEEGPLEVQMLVPPKLEGGLTVK